MTPTPKPKPTAAVPTGSSPPAPGLPGDGQPKHNPPTPWVPNAPPTGNPGPIPGPSKGDELPGFFTTLRLILPAYIQAAHPGQTAQGILDDAVVMTRLLLQNYPQFPWGPDSKN